MDLLPKQFSTAAVFSRLRNNMSLVYWAMLGILVILSGFVIKNSLNIVSASHQSDAPIVVSKGVRVNFDAYDKVISRIQKAESYVPEYQGLGTPFRAKDLK